MNNGCRRNLLRFPKRDWFASFEKLDDGLVQMGDDSTCSMDEVGTILIKMFNELVRGLKDMIYVLRMKKNFILIEASEAQSLEFSDRDGVLKMLKGYMVVLKGIRRNNLYYSKVNTVIR